MTPRERTVARAISRALRGNPTDMDALSTSYSLPAGYAKGSIRERAALLLTALLEAQ